ncbi:MFS transporter [Kitasatospora sp. NPDC056076]|uniref:MFS transporter n=1 Tax=Kitasatospora sp. NPDC056076 TaxID=3345703 RepID=UPI0035DCDC2D
MSDPVKPVEPDAAEPDAADSGAFEPGTAEPSDLASAVPASAAPASPAQDVPLIRNRDFQALWISRFLASVGKESAEVAYPLLMLAITGEAAYAGALGATQLMVTGAVSIAGGTLADRMDRRKLLIACDATRALMLLLFGALVLADRTNVPAVFVLAVVSAVCLGLSEPPALAAIKQVVPASQLTRATAQNQIRPLGATVAGAPIGSSLFGVAQALPFVATALTFVCSALTLLFIRRPMQAAPTGNDERRKALDGFRFILGRPVLVIWIVWIMGSNMAFNHTGAFLALIATAKERGASEPEIGMMLSIAGAGGLVGAALATWVLNRLRPATIFLAAAWLGPVAALLLMTVPGVLPLGLLLACVFLRGPIVNALFFAYVAVLVPDRLQGRVMGAVMFLSYVAQPLGILAVGSIFDLGGAPWVFAFMALVSSLAALPTLTRLIRRLPHPDALATAPS